MGISSFWRSVLIVLSGNVAAKLIPLIATLVTARLYAPHAFGVFSFWLSIVTMVALVLSARFEHVMVVLTEPAAKLDALRATVLTVLLVGALAALIIGAVAVFLPTMPENLSRYLLLMVVPGSIFAACFQVFQSWFVSIGAFAILNKLRIFQVSVTVFMQLGLGYWGDPSADGLAWAYVVGMLSCTIYAVRKTRNAMAFRANLATTAANLVDFWRRFARFPLLAMPSGLFSAISVQLPIWIIINRFGPEMAGLFALAQRVLSVPISFVGVSVLDVFKRQAAISLERVGSCRPEYVSVFKVLGLGSLLVCGIVFLWGENLFVMVFGKRWHETGLIAVWLLPMFGCRYVASPLSFVLLLTNKQSVDFAWQAALLVVAYLSLSIPTSVQASLLTYSFSYAVLYMVSLMLSYHASMLRPKLA